MRVCKCDCCYREIPAGQLPYAVDRVLRMLGQPASARELDIEVLVRRRDPKGDQVDLCAGCREALVRAVVMAFVRMRAHEPEPAKAAGGGN